MALPRVYDTGELLELGKIGALRNGPSLMQTSEAAEFPDGNKPRVISSVEHFRRFLKWSLRTRGCVAKAGVQ